MNIEIQNLDYIIYTNFKILCGVRGITINSELSIGDFNVQRNAHGYIKIEGTKENEKYFIIQITEGSDAYKKAKLEKILPMSGNRIIIKNASVNVKYKGAEIIIGDRYLMYDWIKFNNYKNCSIRKINFEKEWSHLFVHKDDIPGLSIESHEAVWYNLKLGDVVELINPSISNSGYNATIRLVK